VNRSIVETVIITALAGSRNHHPLSRRRDVTFSFPLNRVEAKARHVVVGRCGDLPHGSVVVNGS
jgi:hypothetical protein